jgi:hypothetical protein
MKPRTSRIATICVLGLLLSACNMTVQINTRLNDHGGGTLGLRIAMDREVRDLLEGSNNGQGLSRLEDLFGGLRDQGWVVTRTEPSGGLSLQATRAFKNKAGFEAALAELSGGSAGKGTLGGYRLDYTSTGSFLKTKTQFTGRVDTTSWRNILANSITKGDQKAAQSILDAAADRFRFEIHASLPGSVAVTNGDGTVTNDVAVWRPRLGGVVDIGAQSSAIKTMSLLIVGIPALLILAGAGWFILGRRQRPLIAEAPTPAHRRRERIVVPAPTEQLLAIIPDPAPLSLENKVIDLDGAQQPAEPTA